MEYEISSKEDIEKVISKLTDEMITYAKELNFEKAAEIRDKIKELEKMIEEY
jgi:uvrABC system protein B